MKKVLVTIFAFQVLFSVNAMAESYWKFTTIVNSDSIAMTVLHPSGGPLITESELEVNGTFVVNPSVYQADGEIKITSQDGVVLLHIPAATQKGQWSQQNSRKFTNGDSRVLSGSLILNGKSVSKLIEIKVTE